jgi:hypothetical protein
MSVITAFEAIQILGISTDKIPRIDAIIPPFEGWLCNYLSNYFHTGNWVSKNTYSFSASAITDSETGFLDDGIEFADLMDVHVEGSYLNDGVYSIDTAVAATLTLNSKYTFESEDLGATVTLTRIRWPKGLKLAVAKAIEYELGKTRAINEAPARENPGDVDKEFRYPKRIMDGFKPWLKMKVG